MFVHTSFFISPSHHMFPFISHHSLHLQVTMMETEADTVLLNKRQVPDQPLCFSFSVFLPLPLFYISSISPHVK